MPRGRGEMDDGVRLRILLDEVQQEMQRLGDGHASLAQRLNAAGLRLAGRRGREEGTPGFRTLLQRLGEVERALCDAGEDLEKVGWAILELSRDVKILKHRVGRLGNRFATSREVQAS